MESPLRVTRTGPAQPYADLSAVALPCGIDNPDIGGDAVAAGESVLEIEFVKYRAAVVLYLVDSGLEPTREDIDTIEAISQATGRIAVGLVGAGPWAALWREAITPAIPVGALDERMARTLVLLAEGPPRPEGVTHQGHWAHLRQRQVSAERSRRAAVAARIQSELHEDVRESVDAAVSALSGQPQTVTPRRAFSAVSVLSGRSRETGELPQQIAQIAQELRQQWTQKLRTPVDIPEVRPPALSRRHYLSYVAVVIAALALAAGLGRTLHLGLTAAGMAPALAAVIAAGVNLACGGIVAVVGVRRKARGRRAHWQAEYLARVRRQWSQALLAATREVAGAPGVGWRLEQLVGSESAQRG